MSKQEKQTIIVAAAAVAIWWLWRRRGQLGAAANPIGGTGGAGAPGGAGGAGGGAYGYGPASCGGCGCDGCPQTNPAILTPPANYSQGTTLAAIVQADPTLAGTPIQWNPGEPISEAPLVYGPIEYRDPIRIYDPAQLVAGLDPAIVIGHAVARPRGSRL